jgi:uncharacterized membrane protein
MGRDLDVLDRHFRLWREQGLLAAEVEERLRSASREIERSRVGGIVRAALAVLGGGLVLAGLVLIVAENWGALPRGVKLAGWGLLLLALLGLAHELGKRFPERLALAEAFAMVAGGWVMAGIALVSQIYHLDARTANGVWFWLALVLPAAWLLPRRAVTAVVFVALTSALALEVNESDSIVRGQQMAGPWIWIGLPLLAGAIVSCLPRSLPGLKSWLGLWTFGIGEVFLLVLGAAQQLDRSGLGAAWVVAAAGLAAALVLPRRVLPDSWEATDARLILGLTLVPWMLLGARYEHGNLVDEVAVGAAWIVQLVAAVWVIRAGARTGARAWVNLGYLALLAGVVVRYFDFFGSFLEGGAALALTGILMLFVLYGLEKARRRTLAMEAAS